MNREPVRVLVVDDSALMRKLIPQILEQDPSVKVVGTAIDGYFALKRVPELHPDVITLDMEMPGMSGAEVLSQITRIHHIPVIVVSSHTTQGASATFKALALGAFDFVAKPHDASTHMQLVATELINKIIAAAQSNKAVASSAVPLVLPKVVKPWTPSLKPPTRLVAIGVSTGGPNAMQYLLSHFPSDFPGAILIVQHMPEGFTEMFARRLDDCCAIAVKEAQSGDLVVAGRALVCPGNKHMKIRRMATGDVILLTDEPRVNGHRPSVDVLFNSVAQEFGPRAIAVLMTGMGDDGASGMGAVKAAGGLTIAQDRESCVVFGMPKAAIDRGNAMRVVPLDALANTLQAQCNLEIKESTKNSTPAVAGS